MSPLNAQSPRKRGQGKSPRLQFRDLLKQPGAGEGPVAFGGAFGDVEDEAGFGIGHAGEEAEFDEFGGGGLFGFEFLESFVEHEQGFVVGLHGDAGVLEARLLAAGYADPNHLIDEVVNGDTLKPSKWEKQFTVPMRFNRLILFSPWMFHNSAAGFGTTPADGRLVYLMFFAAA